MVEPLDPVAPPVPVDVALSLPEVSPPELVDPVVDPVDPDGPVSSELQAKARVATDNAKDNARHGRGFEVMMLISLVKGAGANVGGFKVPGSGRRGRR